MKANCNECATHCTRAGNMKRSEWCECADYTRKNPSPLDRIQAVLNRNLRMENKIDAIQRILNEVNKE